MSSALDDFPLDTFGQQPRLECLSGEFPWVAGQIVKEGGVFRIKPLEQTPRLVIKDLRDNPSISMAALREASFPARLLDESVIAPRMTLTGVAGAGREGPPSGGLILTFVAHHQAMDMVGQELVMSLLSKACRGEAFTEEELNGGNMNRKDVIPLLDSSYTPGPEVAGQQIAKSPATEPVEAPPKSTWAYFLFSPSSLSSLKSLTADTLPSNPLIWRHIARSRLPRLASSAISKFTRAVDVRRYMPSIPPTYPGLAQNLVLHTQALDTIAQSSLGDLAAQLRAAVDPKTSNLAYVTSAMATVLDRAEDKSTVSFTGPISPSSDFMLSSWAKVEAYSMDFGFGLPEAVRRPQFTPFEGLGYLVPRRKDGEIAVVLGLREEDLERLKEDEEFVKFGKFIG
ncbi:hypothetical protein FA13DRAFT_1732681 [Coprinellus micaceus]|uniref:Trichothecene 3-O-acetyltransferase-like N-terminal domain-containing protein n=1 Tax=Coprinellus micaceus TaxID=71717 RepID=A0A4Y7TCF1_COPMI|nr:hypothetical protein FA13DRAFT_1732681 [Coprinellus micaceus]